jgi:hypothetical protein
MVYGYMGGVGDLGGHIKLQQPDYTHFFPTECKYKILLGLVQRLIPHKFDSLFYSRTLQTKDTGDTEALHC